MESETTEEILAATRRALCEHGYAGLTMQRIAAESSLSTAAIHYHYDTKEGVLNAFLEHVVDGFECRVRTDADDPRARLAAFLDAVFESTGDHDGFAVAFMELKAQAAFHEAYRERFVEMDQVVRTVVVDAVRDGVERGHFQDADPERVARHVVTTLNGAHVRGVALGEPAEAGRALVESYLAETLGWTPEVPA